MEYKIRMDMNKDKLNDRDVEVMKKRVLDSVDSPNTGIKGNNSTYSDAQELILTQPLTSGRLVSKIMNKVFHLPLFMFKKSTINYVSQRTLNDSVIKEGINDLLVIEQNNTESILSKLDDKVYEFMKHNDSLKSELMAEINKNEPLANLDISKNEPAKEKIVNKDRVKSLDRINVGSGSHILDDYINMDHREIKGVDLVGDISNIPVEKGTMQEVFASHVVEHFTERQIIPILKHWYELLKPGGKIRIIVPDIESMALGFANKTVRWDQLRMVVLGGQDYSSDYHLNMFSVKYIQQLTAKSVPKGIFKTIDSGRKNGECLELEVEITKPKS